MNQGHPDDTCRFCAHLRREHRPHGSEFGEGYLTALPVEEGDPQP